MDDAYTKIVNLILGMPDEGILNIPCNENKDKIISFIKTLIDESYFLEYGFDVEFSNDYSKVRKKALLNERSLTRFPQLDTYGKLIFCINNPEMYKIYDRENNRLKHQEHYEGGYIEPSE